MTRRLNSRRTRELDLRVAWLLMLLYPRAWRDRYGAEVLRLTRELVAAGETTPARAALAGALCSLHRPAAGAVMTGCPATVTGLVPAGPTFTLSLPAGPRVIPSPRLLVPVIFASPGQGARRLCVEPPARCRIGMGYVVKVTPSRPVVRVTVKRAGCALDLAEASASRLDREQRAAIRELIQRDHAFHGKPHRRTPSR